MTAVSTEEYESLRLALQKLIVCGLSPNREEFAVNGIFSLHDFNLIQSLFYQMYLRNARKRIPRYENSTVTSWMHEANSGGFKLKDIATRSGYSPYKVAKCFLSCVHHHTGMIAFMEEPDTILNTNKSFEVVECCVEDPLCSTVVDIRKNCTGKEFESYLEKRLRALNVCFETEADLRLSGRPKTPDILLSIPMLVHTEEGFHFLVNWIDSKGMFADAETMKEHEVVSDNISTHFNR